MKIDLYNDGIGSVELVQHMGTDLTIVNSARVSFANTKKSLMKKMKSLSIILLSTSTLLRLSIM